ncbi:MAG TPA: hypothetical protein PKO09_05000 [Anaerolineae bacterium]|nr:hypothetical protein [Anaerolineae bacterium]
MNQTIKIAATKPLRIALLVAVTLVIALLVSPPTGLAQGGTCIDDVTGRTNTCTANDVRISELRNSENVSCEAGSDVELNLRARLVATANERYDLGTFVALDGGDARTGTCQQDYLPPPLSAGGTCSGSGQVCHWDGDCPAGEACTGGYDPLSGAGPFFNAEAAEDENDLCGDIEQAVETFYDLVTVTVPCQDMNGDGYLDIGTCVSWDNQKSNTCVDVSGAIPNNKAKCNCEMTTVGNVIVHGSIQVTKTPLPDTLTEPGGNVEFTFVVTNPSPATVTVDTLEDSVYGDLTVYPETTCEVPQTLEPTQSYTCTILASLTGDPGVHPDTVTASGADQNQDPVEASAMAQVVITDLLPTIVLTKTVEPVQLVEPGGTVTYTVNVENRSGVSDPVTLTSLTDSLYGDLTDPANPEISDSTCQLTEIEPGDVYSCTFKAEASGTGGTVISDMATALGSDDEGNPATASDDAAVTITSSLELQVLKEVEPECVKSGDVATYTVVVTNPNDIPLDLILLDDDIYDDLTDPDNPKIGDSTCELATIEASDSFSCTFEAVVVLTGTATSLTDVVTAQASDRAGKTAMDSDDATINLCILPPDTGVGMPASVLVGGLAGLGAALAAAGAWLRRRSR